MFENNFSKTKVCLVLVSALIWLGGIPGNSYASPCTQKDEDYADSWDNYYTPQEAYGFGKKIQDLVRNQDLEGIFQLVEGELRSGPRKNFVKGKSFNEIFHKNWVKSILASEPPCSPIGWRGFLMAHKVWFVKREKWQIVAIHGAMVEQRRIGSDIAGWKINGSLLHPKCFTTEWWSSDNFKAILQYYKISNSLELLRESPGVFLGKEITDFSPSISTWCILDGCSDYELSLAHSIEYCATKKSDHYLDGNSVQAPSYIDSEGNSSGSIAYHILATVSSSDCEKLAPNLDVKCESSYLVFIDEAGGSMGKYTYGIYGVFVLDPIGLAVVPLKYFDTYNDSLNFLDKLASET